MTEVQPLTGQSATREARPNHSTPNQRAWRRFKRNRLAVWSLRSIALLILLIIAWPICLRFVGSSGKAGARWAQGRNPDQLSDDQFQKPSGRHWFGTDVH